MQTKKFISLIALTICSFQSYAYDPRSYNVVPKDISMIEIQHSEIETKKQINLTTSLNLESNVEHIRYLKYFNFLDNLAGAYIVLPYQNNNGKINIGSNNVVNENPSNFGDIKLFLGLGIYNSPALTREEFSQYNRNGIKVACSEMLSLPTGNFNSSKYFSVGSNQTSLKSECSGSYTQNKFVAEYSQGFTVYSDNTEYLKTNLLQKENLYHQEIHLSYTLAPQMWGGVSLFHQSGAGSYVNHKFANDSQENTSIGLIMNYYIDRKDIIKVNYQKTLSSPDLAQKQDYWAIAYQKLF